MSAFNEAQLEAVFVDQFKEQDYEHVHSGIISHDVRDELLYDVTCATPPFLYSIFFTH